MGKMIILLIIEELCMFVCKCFGIRVLDILREISILKKYKMKID